MMATKSNHIIETDPTIDVLRTFKQLGSIKMNLLAISNIDDTIVNTTIETDATLIIIPWRTSKPSFAEDVYHQALMDRVGQQAPCSVVIIIFSTRDSQ